jgi:hypothetical protein
MVRRSSFSNLRVEALENRSNPSTLDPSAGALTASPSVDGQTVPFYLKLQGVDGDVLEDEADLLAPDSDATQAGTHAGGGGGGAGKVSMRDFSFTMKSSLAGDLVAPPVGASGGHVKVFDGRSGGDLGNDWLVGGTGRDGQAGGAGLDVLIADTGGDRDEDNQNGTHVAGTIAATGNNAIDYHHVDLYRNVWINQAPDASGFGNDVLVGGLGHDDSK